MISADYGNAGGVLMVGFLIFAMSGKMWSVLMVVFLIFPHELFVELFSSWFGDIRRLHVGVPQP